MKPTQKSGPPQTRPSSQPTVLFLCVVAALAWPQSSVALEELTELPDAEVSASIDDGRVWEDVSYGTGEALFTAVALDPDQPRRVYAGANGAVYVSDDGGVTWTRTLRVRGSSSVAVQTSDGPDVDKLVEDEVADRVEAERDDLLEEIKQQITDDLVAELGSYGEELADELAEELALQQLADQEAELEEEIRADLARSPSSASGEESIESSTAVPIEPRRIHRILALPGGRVLVASGSGLFESTDRGQTFESFSFGHVPAERDVRSVAVDPRRPQHLLAGTLAGLYASTDGGESWQEVGGFPDKLAFFDLAVDPSSPLRVLAASNDGVYLSTDGGLSFELVNQPSAPLARDTRAVAFDPVDPRIAFAGTQEGLFRSLDAGAEWERVEAPGLLSRDVQDFRSMDWGLIASSSNGVFLSADSGESFRELYAGLDSQDVARVAASQVPLDVYAATDRGLFAYRAQGERARKGDVLSEIRALLDSEPSLESVSQRAIAHAQVDLPVESWRTRAAIAPLMPRLTVRWNGNDPWEGPFDRRVAGTTVPPTIYNFMERDAGWTAQLTWNLLGVVMPSQTLDVSSTFRRTEKHRSRVLRRVVNTYNARRRLQVALIQSPPSDVLSYARKTLQVDELSAVLDGLTDGWFTDALASAGARAQTRKR